jgi:hypothetical protein
MTLTHPDEKILGRTFVGIDVENCNARVLMQKDSIKQRLFLKASKRASSDEYLIQTYQRLWTYRYIKHKFFRCCAKINHSDPQTVSRRYKSSSALDFISPLLYLVDQT